MPAYCLRLLLAAALALTGGAASAGEITGFSWTSGVASIAGISVPPPTNPNNDNWVGPSPNLVEILQKHYIGLGPIDIEFTVAPSGGTTEYHFREGVQNSTGLDWTTYCMQLGYGTGADFTLSPAGDGLDFDAPDYDSPVSFSPYGASGPFPTVVVGEDLIEASGGVQSGYAEPFFFSIDVPDGITSFTLRQLPKDNPVPEPSAVVLAAAAGLICRRRHLTGSNRSRSS